MRKKNTDKENVNLDSITSQATAEAFKKARKTGIPVIIKEGNFLVELFPDGEKKVLKQLSGTRNLSSSKFKISH